MSLRSRVALLVAATVLLTSAIGGIGAAITSRGVGRDRIDQELQADAARFPADAPRLSIQLQRALEARRATCGDDTSLAEDSEPSTGRDGRRLLSLLPRFGNEIQLIRPNQAVVSACQTIPINDTDLAIGAAGAGSQLRTVSIDDQRFRVLTEGYEDLGAVQFARSLRLTDDTVQSLLLRVLGFAVVGSLLAGPIGWLFAKRATDPVKRLNETAKRVADTQDLGERIEVEGDEEIRTLAISFNTMLSSLDTSREQQQRLVQDASHELRTPLTSMRTNVELLQRHPDIDPEMRSQVLGDIQAELAELTDLTSELVESATEVPLQLQAVGPVDLIDVATDAVETARRRHHRTITLTISDDPRSVVAGDASLLGRAATNLLNNAVKFSAESTDIEVEVSGSKIAVHDRGPGIAEEDLELIFDRFYRATAARSAPGSGLGLAIVKQIVDGHQGWVNASNRDGGGATIGFSLPPDPQGSETKS